MNKVNNLSCYLVVVSLLGSNSLASAQEPHAVNFRPQCSIEQPGDAGARVHTHLRVVVPPSGQEALNAQIDTEVTPYGTPPGAGYYETPASVGCVYGLTTAAAGCNPQTLVENPVGGSRAIAIVDAYNYPTALADLQHFSAQFGLPQPNLGVVYANGIPPTDSGWALEAALDLQWAHAMAPGAKLYLVLAKDSSMSEMLRAVDTASGLVAAAGGGQVSMSWGTSEFSAQYLYDSHFTRANVVYIASAGDAPGTSWPGTSPYVVGVGGTTLKRDLATGDFLRESAWSETGGGPSVVYVRPSYQNIRAVAATVGTRRGSPDVALAASPNTGAWVYDSSSYNFAGWWIVGGTSWSTATYAGITNAAGRFALSSIDELSTIYSALDTSNFRDITLGSCGPNQGYQATVGWDFCTGAGVGMGYLGVWGPYKAINCTFDWAEGEYPGLFAPAGPPTDVWSIYTYRYYSATDSYVGVSSADNHAYYMGPDRILHDEGPLSYWLARSGCQ